MESVFKNFCIDHYLVGAVAIDIHLLADENAIAMRKTDDIDLAVTVSDEGKFNELKRH